MSRPEHLRTVEEFAERIRLGLEPLIQEAPQETFAFLSPQELYDAGPDEVPWIWDGYVAENAMTLVSGKPKAGKSTLVFGLVGAMVTGQTSFAGRDLVPGPVVYLSEEGRETLVPKLRASLIPGDAPLHLRPRMFPKPEWASAIRSGVIQCEAVGSKLLVVDTFRFWAALASNDEKDAGAIGQAMVALSEACASGIAVLLVHHERKGGGEEGEGVSGSTAIAGSVDVVLEIHRVKDGRPTQRLLLALSRWDQTPEALLLDRQLGSYAPEGEGDRDEVVGDAKRRRVLRVLEEAAEPLTADEVGETTGMGRQHAQAALLKLLAEGSAEREGAGKRGSPYRWFVSQDEAMDRKLSPGTAGQSLVSVSVPPLWEGEKKQKSSAPEDAPGQQLGQDTIVGAEVEDWRDLVEEDDQPW